MKEIIHIDIAPDGSLTMEAEGYTGKDCLQATATLEKALGSVSTREHKPVYFRTPRRTVQQRIRNRHS